jgi:hypothetical protein
VVLVVVGEGEETLESDEDAAVEAMAFVGVERGAAHRWARA